MKTWKTLRRPAITLALVVVLMTVAGCGSGDWTGTYVPPDDPAGNIYVHDDVDVLYPDTEKRVYELNKTLEREHDGAQFIVVTIRHSDVQIEEEARKLADQYHPGRQCLDNGMLYVINREDDTERLEVGSGLKNLVPDRVAKTLMREARNHSTDEDSTSWDAGVNNLVDNIQCGLESGDMLGCAAKSRWTPSAVVAIAFAAIFMIFILVVQVAAILRKKHHESTT